jgi:hypothetical protein
MLDHIGGVYCEDADVAELSIDSSSPENQKGVKSYSLDKVSAKRLWEWSEQVTGIEFGAEVAAHASSSDK